MLLTLITKNIKRYRYRYAFIFLITFIINLSLFAGNSFVQEVKTGIDTVRNRLGADIVLLPGDIDDSDVKAEEILFHGCPSTFAMEDITADIEGINAVTECVSRLYLASLGGQSCCDGSIQLIATDISKDFLLNPYTKVKTLNDNEIILGSRSNVEIGGIVKYFGREFVVKDKLSKTNTGIDESGFISFNAAHLITDDPKYKHTYFDDFTDNSISMIFIKTDDPHLTNDVIKSRFGKKVSVYVPDKKIADYTRSMLILSKSIGLLNVSLMIVGILSILCITLVSTETRRNEFGSMILMGYKPMHCFAYFTSEHVIVTTFASMCALIIHLLTNNLSTLYISRLFNVPVIKGNQWALIVIVFVLTVIFTMSATTISTMKMNETSPAKLIKEAA